MGRCFAVDEVTMVKEGRNDFDDFDDLLAPAVDVAFDLGHLAFVGIDGGNDVRFCLAGISNLKGFGSINHMEGIGSLERFTLAHVAKNGPAAMPKQTPMKGISNTTGIAYRTVQKPQKSQMWRNCSQCTMVV